MLATLPPLARFALACAGLIALAWVLVGRGGESGGDAATTSTSTTAPSPFGPAPDSGTGVVLAEGLVLPVTGGADGRWAVLSPCANEVIVDGQHLRGAHVVLDPGHGGRETGAIGPSGVVEAELNLDVAQRAATLLEDLGATVVLTRDDDTRLTIETRAAIARALDPLLFVSIHHNGGPTSSSAQPGVQVYHQHETPASARFASLLFEQLESHFLPLSDTWSGGSATGVRARLDESGEDYYGILRGSAGVPAVLAEALYLSSEPEASLLLDDEVRQAEAQAIADAVVEWIETPRAGSGFLPPLQASESAGGGGGAAGCDDPRVLASVVVGG